MSVIDEKYETAVDYTADLLEEVEYGEKIAKAGTAAGFGGGGALLATRNIGAGVIALALGDFSHEVGKELGRRELEEEYLFEGLDEEFYGEDLDEIVDLGEDEYEMVED